MIQELNIFGKYNIADWLVVLILSISILLSSGLLHLIIFKILKHSKKKDKFLITKIQERLRIPSLLLLITIALNIILLSFVIENPFVLGIKHLFKKLIILGFAWISIGFVKLGKDLVLSRYDISEKDNLKARRVYTQFKIIEGILSFI
nr:hypothetical protein [Spirochaetaceae bacterium]